MGIRGRGGDGDLAILGESTSVQCRYENGVDAAHVQGRQESESTYSSSDAARCSDGFYRTAPVGSYQPNAFGLYDVLGNVLEWTEDCWNETYAGVPTDGRACWSGNCSYRVLRGGSWNIILVGLRSAFRYRHLAEIRNYDIRVPCGPDNQLKPASLPRYLLHGSPGGSAPGRGKAHVGW